MGKLVVVSNRLPIAITKKDGKLSYVHTSGGLGTAMSSLDIDDFVWVGWPGIASDELTDEEMRQITQDLKEQFNYIPVFQTRQQIALYYEGYANDTLWPLFHYFQSHAVYRDEYWTTYQEVNQLFLQAIESVADDDSRIWIHDYHLMLLPEMTRRVLPDAKIGFFLHIPFPSYEIFRLIPERKELIRGMLGADLVGFHIYDYARHFLSSSQRLLGATSDNGTIEHDGRMVKVDTFPIGVDYGRFKEELAKPAVKKELRSLTKRFIDQKLIVAVDRLDYSKGIPERLAGFERFLAEHPEYHEKVVFHMIAAPSRTEVETYRQLRDSVEQTVSRINGLYATYRWSPIAYQFQNLGFDKIVPLYHRADVALVTPVRDGMNLVAKEYVASKQAQPGVLILSETAGAADELMDALLINPNDAHEVATAIHEALEMPTNAQLTRLERMQERIADYTVQKWGNDFLGELDAVSETHKGSLQKRLRSADSEVIVREYRQATSRLLLLDYDGTLHHFVATPGREAARPDAELLAMIDRLAKQPGTKVIITSGRDRQTLQSWFGHFAQVSLVAEHGAWTRDHGEWKRNTEEFDKKPYLDIMKRYGVRTAGSVIDEKEFSVVWHYRRVNPELAYIRNAGLRHELREATEHTDIGVYDGRKIIEVKPRGLHKGVIARESLDKYPSDFILCAGDDYTDEEAFRVMPAEAHTIKIGFGQTHARYQVGKMEKILTLLDKLSHEKIGKS